MRESEICLQPRLRPELPAASGGINDRQIPLTRQNFRLPRLRIWVGNSLAGSTGLLRYDLFPNGIEHDLRSVVKIQLLHQVQPMCINRIHANI